MGSEPQVVAGSPGCTSGASNYAALATLGMWLFLASEGMFFIVMLGAFVVLQSTPQQHQLFVESSKMLSGWIGLTSVLLLGFCSGAILANQTAWKWIAVGMGVAFLLLQNQQWHLLRMTSRNNFFASYFLMSAVHGLHLAAGLLGLLWMLMRRKGKVPPALGNYWHFVNLVGIIGLAALYFV